MKIRYQIPMLYFPFNRNIVFSQKNKGSFEQCDLWITVLLPTELVSLRLAVLLACVHVSQKPLSLYMQCSQTHTSSATRSYLGHDLVALQGRIYDLIALNVLPDHV